MKILRATFPALFIMLCSASFATAQANGPVTFHQLAELTSSDGAPHDEFGYSVAMSENILVAGAPQYENGGTGKAYVFAKPASGSWSNAIQIAELAPSNGTPGLGFGAKVVISGSTIVVADSPVEGQQSGEYVFVEPEGGWADMTETAQLYLPNGEELGNVAIAGDAIIVGGIKSNSFLGWALYVFVEPKGGWNSNAKPKARLTSSDLASSFGYALAFDGNTVAATSPNDAVYVFSKPTGGWVTATQTATLTLSDETGADEFAASVAVSGKTILVGAPETGSSPQYFGEAYLYYEPPTGWVSATESADIQTPNYQMWGFFGNSVSASGGLVAIGSDGANLGSNTLVGGVFVFTGTTQLAELTPSDAQQSEQMGWSVVASGDTIAAGAVYATVGSNSQQGKVYIFGPWNVDRQLLKADVSLLVLRRRSAQP